MTEDEIRQFDESLPVRLPEVIVDVAFWATRLDAYIDNFALGPSLEGLVITARDHLAVCEDALRALVQPFTQAQESVHGPYENPLEIPDA